MVEELKLIHQGNSKEKFLIDFSEKVSRLNGKNLILFSNNFFNSIIKFCFDDTDIDLSSSYADIPEDSTGTIETKMCFNDGSEFIFDRKIISDQMSILTFLKYSFKGAEYRYFCPKNIDDTQNTFKMPDNFN